MLSRRYCRDEPNASQLLAMVTRPVKAVILLFPISEAYEQKRREEDERIATQGQHAIDPTVFWMKQTVSVSCHLGIRAT